MANDVLTRNRDTDIDAHSVAQSEADRTGIETEVRALTRIVERVELALNPYTPQEQRIMTLEAENRELRYYCYAAGGLLLFIFLMARK